MRWEEVFGVFLVCHLAGDYLLQTDFQAINKRGGLSGDATARRALFSHVFMYTLCFVPALVWIVANTTTLAIGLAAVIGIPHLVQDDARLVMIWNRRVKSANTQPGDLLYMCIDQSFHVVALFGAALLAVA